jgi:hypothetical protein
LLNIKTAAVATAAVFNSISKHKSTFVFLFLLQKRTRKFFAADISFICACFLPLKNASKIQRFFAKKSPFFNQK